MPTHQEVCKRAAGIGDCDCCVTCGNHVWAPTDNRCLHCHPAPTMDAPTRPTRTMPVDHATRLEAGDTIYTVDADTGEVLHEEPVPDPTSPVSLFAPITPVSHATDPVAVIVDTVGMVSHHHPVTSQIAAHSVPTGKRRVQVLTALAGLAFGATAEELESVTGLGGSTIRPRLLELTRDGFVMRSTTTRPTRSGMQAVVHEATARGRAALERIAAGDV